MPANEDVNELACLTCAPAKSTSVDRAREREGRQGPAGLIDQVGGAAAATARSQRHDEAREAVNRNVQSTGKSAISKSETLLRR
ncbi:MAG: hypothetical protein V4515_10485 [Chloroflexota bacterium]